MREMYYVMESALKVDAYAIVLRRIALLAGYLSLIAHTPALPCDEFVPFVGALQYKLLRRTEVDFTALPEVVSALEFAL